MKKYLPIILFVILFGLGGYLILRQNGRVIDVSIGQSASGSTSTPSFDSNLPRSPISGLPCANAERRPVAVMLAADKETRPLSGISEADLVFNMPVLTNSTTRLMAVYVCASPGEIGSVRSARHDFIPLALGLDAIFAHWGGSHFALDDLDKGIADNVDALPNPFGAYFRKSGVVSPHDGFTSYSRLFNAAQKLGYRLTNNFGGYPHWPSSAAPMGNESKTLFIGFPGEFAVKYVYDPSGNSYLRWRGGLKEIDKNSGRQVSAKNVAIMFARSSQIEEQYNDMDIEGSGKARVYRNGEEISGVWKKSAASQSSKLFFYDSAGEEIKFMPGQIWVEIVQTNQSIIYK